MADKSVLFFFFLFSLLEDLEEQVVGGNKKMIKNSDGAQHSCKVYGTGWVGENMMRSSCDRGVHDLHMGQTDTG